MPFFSVVIPTYNQIALLPECLASVYQQNFSDFEVILIDDGSSDNTGNYVKANFPLVIYTFQKNAGPSTARNLGASKASGRYIAFLDADDLWYPWTLQIWHTELTRLGQDGICVGRTVQFSDKLPPRTESSPASPSIVKHDDYIAAGAQGLWIAVGAVALPRIPFQKSGGFDETLFSAEDSDLWLKLGMGFPCITFENPPVLAYRRQPGSLSENLENGVEAAWQLISREHSGGYPGGEDRAAERREILTTHFRPLCIALTKKGYRKAAQRLYWKILAWNFQQRRFRFIVGFWGILLRQKLTRNT